MVIEFPIGSEVVADRGYMDFSRLYDLKKQVVFFVVSCLENIKMALEERELRKNNDGSSKVEVDWEGHFSLYKSKHDYPNKIRMVQIWVEEEQIYIERMTNNFTCTASTKDDLY